MTRDQLVYAVRQFAHLGAHEFAITELSAEHVVVVTIALGVFSRARPADLERYLGLHAVSVGTAVRVEEGDIYDGKALRYLPDEELFDALAAEERRLIADPTRGGHFGRDINREIARRAG